MSDAGKNNHGLHVHAVHGGKPQREKNARKNVEENVLSFHCPLFSRNRAKGLPLWKIQACQKSANGELDAVRIS